MSQEYYIDRIGNVSVQGPVVTIDLGRVSTSGTKKEQLEFEKKLSITLTGQNLVHLVTSLTKTLKAISERNTKDKETLANTPEGVASSREK
jgi:hypothetical protein